MALTPAVPDLRSIRVARQIHHRISALGSMSANRWYSPPCRFYFPRLQRLAEADCSRCANLDRRLCADQFHFKVMTADRDLGDTNPYRANCDRITGFAGDRLRDFLPLPKHRRLVAQRFANSPDRELTMTFLYLNTVVSRVRSGSFR